MKVEVLFFGVLAEKSGVNRLKIEGANNLDSLRQIIFEKYPALKEYSFRISINRNLSKGNKKLSDGDEVAFLPPFAGG